jgi:hypothetical protein
MVEGGQNGTPSLAIFCASGHSHHSTWLKLTEDQIRQRLRYNDVEDAPVVEYARALETIAEHERWLRLVIAAKGAVAALKDARERARRPPS